MKKIMLTVLTSLAIVQQTSPRGGGDFGGGFAVGALGATAITLAATSGSRNADRGADYYDYRKSERSRSDLRRAIKDEQREITRLNKEVRQLKRDIERQGKHNDSNDLKDKKQQMEEHKQDIKDHKENIRDLNDDIKNL